MEAYLLHDANAGSNPKLMIMIQEEGMKGYGIYWTVLEFLRLQNEYKASLKVIFPYWHKSKGDNRHTEANHL